MIRPTQMSDDELRRLYVLADRGRLNGKVAADLDAATLEWAVDYNEQTITWIQDGEVPWTRDGEPRRSGKTAKQVFTKARTRNNIQDSCRIALRALNAEVSHRKRSAGQPAAPAEREPVAEPVDLTFVPDPENSAGLGIVLADRMEWAMEKAMEDLKSSAIHIKAALELQRSAHQRVNGLLALASQLRKL